MYASKTFVIGTPSYLCPQHIYTRTVAWEKELEMRLLCEMCNFVRCQRSFLFSWEILLMQEYVTSTSSMFHLVPFSFLVLLRSQFECACMRLFVVLLFR